MPGAGLWAGAVFSSGAAFSPGAGPPPGQREYTGGHGQRSGDQQRTGIAQEEAAADGQTEGHGVRGPRALPVDQPHRRPQCAQDARKDRALRERLHRPPAQGGGHQSDLARHRRLASGARRAQQPVREEHASCGDEQRTHPQPGAETEHPHERRQQPRVGPTRGEDRLVAGVVGGDVVDARVALQARLLLRMAHHIGRGRQGVQARLPDGRVRSRRAQLRLDVPLGGGAVDAEMLLGGAGVTRGVRPQVRGRGAGQLQQEEQERHEEGEHEPAARTSCARLHEREAGAEGAEQLHDRSAPGSD
ncbi:hypothetical protein [Streptomyces sp. N35]|uniref:hypothetical protein n=1 Tax=Streptomyces sp. N35 TaxID=2795730 RepID=UPI001F1DE541|nr:hypothetical protein [Streptomyces sp. N35]